MQLTSRTLQPLPERKRSIIDVPWGKVAAIGILLLMALFFLSPLFWVFVTALKSVAQMAAYPIQWFPQPAHFQNFLQAMTMIDYLHYAWNSIALSTIYATLTTLSSALVGFAFARLKGWGQRPLFMLMLSTLMLPPILTIIPTYMLFARIGLINTYWPWVLWGLSSSPFLTFLFRQFFTGIPIELEEAAILDGCSYGYIFWRIFLPLSGPVLATAAVLSFNAVWGDFLGPSLFLNQNNTTLAVAMSSGYTDQYGTPLLNVLSAGILLYLIPVVLLFLFAQRYFMQGIVTSGLKG